MVTLALSHWLLGPLVLLFTPLLQLSWLGWAALALGLWLLAGGSPGAGADDRDRSRGS
jgi:hypothetical protein